MYFTKADPNRTRRRIPVRGVGPGGIRDDRSKFYVDRPVNSVDNRVSQPGYSTSQTSHSETLTGSVAPVDRARVTVKPESEKTVLPANGETDWQEKAWRLQADMDNFRKRQKRRADELIGAERERLLSTFLPVVDNLARALAHQDRADDALRQGVELTHRQLTQLLEAEGVTRLETVGQPFDPEWHEAIAVIESEAEADMIVEEIEAGYTLETKLLRPAKVVVAA